MVLIPGKEPIQEWIRQHKQNVQVRRWLRENAPPKDWKEARTAWAYINMPRELLRADPALPCSVQTSILKTDPPRRSCGVPGAIYNVTGMLTGLAVVLCGAHATLLRRMGLTVEKVTPLEQLQGKAEAQRTAGLRTLPKPEPEQEAPSVPAGAL